MDRSERLLAEIHDKSQWPERIPGLLQEISDDFNDDCGTVIHWSDLPLIIHALEQLQKPT